MNNIIKLSALAVLTFMVSCVDLDETPEGSLTPEGFFNTVEDVYPMIDGTYGLMASSSYYGAGLTVPLQLMSDMVDNGYEFGDYAEFSPFLVTPTNSYVNDVWASSYQTIATANTAIKGIGLLNDTNEEEKILAEGEARFVRAFLYYHLVRLYGNIPYIDNPDIADPLSIKQATKEEVYAKIIEDMTFAFNHLEITSRGSVKSRPSKGTAATYLSSIYLTLGNWEKSYENAKWVIDNAGQLNYALQDDYQNIFRNSEQWVSTEDIFTIDFTNNQTGQNPNPVTYENDNKVGPFNGVEGGVKPIRGWSMLVPHINVYNNWDVRDYRLKVSLADSLILDDGTDVVRPYTDFEIARPHIAKFNRFPGEGRTTAGWRSDLDFVAFRYAEVLLIAAESANELGLTTEAVGYLNQIRKRARNAGAINFEGSGYGVYMASSYPEDVDASINKENLRTTIIEERRVELAFEFKRWYDIVRLDLGNEVFNIDGLEPQSNFNEFRYLLPIPQDEMNKNENFVQNSGY
ncbi:RagB/SusD family nutrient uptake outer membrane protein [Polaribacter sp. HaHaR_3_91]|uniref:RagB/SusD family nutrient uptake outer membrane protein n=1 Tax=Polaribacter sp. HaHaR_3_91 TaxID=2745561 RepID=UPI001C4F25E5|nr:RagB/SusD family nutrient uptake outer membrane protein [Polaribacter sp. HaHaR_3_91]QXP62502.1 RagB/SusD family nutrient uptake outer membrane protein [Polaribacter sp. HaHaR_3_91]